MKNAVRRRIASLLLALAATGIPLLAAAATYSVNQIDYVDPVTHATAFATTLWGNNNNGKVIGNAQMDAAGTIAFSFVYDPAVGTFTRVTAPAGVDPAFFGAISINDSDDITGTLFDAAGVADQGFILVGGTVTYFSHPSFGNTSARTISNHTALHPQGLVVGFAYDHDALGNITNSVGFLYDPVANTFTDLPGTTSPFTIAQGLNSAGQSVGHIQNAVPPPRFSGFLYTPTGADPMAGGTTTTFNIGTFRTKARGINDHGIMAIAVTDDPASGATHTYVGTSSGFELITVPNTTGPACVDGTVPNSFPEGLNNAGVITGLYNDNSATCAQHGFIATPSALPTGTTASGAYTFTIDVVPDTPYFLDPAVAIGYDFQIGKKDPRFATVRLPLGIGDNKYVLVVGHRGFDLNAGQLFDFRTHGYKKGVTGFRVACIDPAALLDPVNSLAFPTEVTFTEAGRFTGTQQPLTHVKFKGDDLGAMTQAQCRAKLLGGSDDGGPDPD